MRRATTLALFVLLASAAPAKAAHDPDRLAARQHDEAMVLYDLGRYEDAIRALERGYRLSPKRPGFLYSEGVILLQLGNFELRLGEPLARRHLAQSAELFRHYLARRPDDPERPSIDMTIASLDRKVDALAPQAAREPEPAQHVPAPPVEERPKVEMPRAADREEMERVRNRNIGIGFDAGGVLSVIAAAILLRESGRLDEKITNGLADISSGRAPDSDLSNNISSKTVVDAFGWISLTAGAASLAFGFYYATKPVGGSHRRLRIAPSANGAMLDGTF